MKALSIAALSLLLLSDYANAELLPETVGLHLATAHSKSGFCDFNPGVYGRWASGFTAGVYRNSECNTSAYAGWTWETKPIIFGVRAAITVGGVIGYQAEPILPLAVPSLAAQINKSTALRLGYIPKVEKRGAHALHLMVERKGNFDGVGVTQ